MIPTGPTKKAEVPEVKLQSNLFNRVAELRQALSHAPVVDMIWVHDIGDWKFAVNGYAKHHKVTPRNSTPTRVPPYSMVFWYKGSYVGWCNPNFAIILEEYNTDGSAEFSVGNLEHLIEEEIKINGGTV